MRAVLCDHYGGLEDLRLAEVPEPPLRPKTVRIGVTATALNFADLLMISGTYQLKPDPPFSPGFEVCGRVLEMGDGVSGFSLGDRVAAFTWYGAYAEQVVVPSASVFPAPEAFSDLEAAAFVITYGTAVHALSDRAGLATGETLVVLGAAGGVGSAAIQVGKRLGARVIAAVGSEAKEAAVRGHGADDIIRYEREDLKTRIRELTGGEGADVAFDPVGGDATEAVLRALAWNGRLLVIGFSSGSIPSIPANLPLLKGSSVVGVFWGAFADRDPTHNRANFETLRRWAGEGAVRPSVAEVLPLERARAGLELLASRRAVGRVVLTVP